MRELLRNERVTDKMRELPRNEIVFEKRESSERFTEKRESYRERRV